jgi:serine transporter
VPPASAFLHTLWLAIPVMVFSFNHSPIISAFAVDQKRRYGDHADERSGQILRRAHLLMVVMVLFFVFSCVLTLSSAQLAEAKAQNLSILSYLANHFSNPTIAFAAPLIAFVAIAKSFLGHYIGASEGLKGMIVKTGAPGRQGPGPHGRRVDAGGVLDRRHPQPEHPRHDRNPRWPDHRVLLFLMPMYAIRRVPSMRKYSGALSNVFVVVVGLVALTSVVYGLLG